MCLRVLGKLGCGGISLDHFDLQEPELFILIFVCIFRNLVFIFYVLLIFVIAFLFLLRHWSQYSIASASLGALPCLINSCSSVFFVFV